MRMDAPSEDVPDRLARLGPFHDMLILALATWMTACATPEATTMTRPSSPLMASGGPPGAIRHVFLVSVDGLLPEAYTAPDKHGLRVPHLRRMRADGWWAPGLQVVFPSVTYPNHTSMVTGVHPARHGIHGNRAFDPLRMNQGGWNWYAEDIQVRTIWGQAHQAGYRTAMMSWPVTVGAEATLRVPEFWRAGTPDDAKLVRALSAPEDLFEGLLRRFPDVEDRLTPPNYSDAGGTDVIVYAIEQYKPHLLLHHIVNVDHEQHGHGPWSSEAKQAVEESDRLLGRIIEAAQRAGIWDQTVMVVASDHGFLRIHSTIRPNVLLRREGLITVNEDGRVKEWQASALSNGGSAYVYLHPDAPPDAARRARNVFAERPGIRRVLDEDAIHELDGDPGALLALDAEEGFAFADDLDGPPMGPTSERYVATHGYDPRRPGMKASLLAFGPPIRTRRLDGATLVDIAPTIAEWLGLDLGETDGQSLAP
ncbi:MAG: alkaline phosphatase family protein [Myxococcota bacterium]